MFADTRSQKTKEKKIDARLKLEEELTKYDIKYIKHRNEAFTKSSIANQINNFKLILININLEMSKQKDEKIKIIKEMTRK